jgi:flagellar motor protein MotB
MADDRPEFIVVRRHRDPGEGRHGGAWKIAFADFMTAMMAFFLVLWIINAKDNPKKLLGRYFAVRVEEPAGAPKGVHEIKSSVQETNGQKIVEANGQEKPGAPINREPSSQRESKSGDATLRDTSASKREDSSQRGALEASEPAANKPTVPESELLSDPYRSLDTIASGDATLTMAPGVDSGSDPTRRAGLRAATVHSGQTSGNGRTVQSFRSRRRRPGGSIVEGAAGPARRPGQIAPRSCDRRPIDGRGATHQPDGSHQFQHVRGRLRGAEPGARKSHGVDRQSAPGAARYNSSARAHGWTCLPVADI